MAESSTTPPMRRGVSDVGKQATFSTPDEEVARILKNKENFYICLKVLKDTDSAEIRANYFKLSRLVHPDKCKHPDAPSASAVLNQAKETLTNPLKKRLYDAYVADITATEGPDMSYAEWEAAQAQYPVKIPAWLEKILRIPVVGQIAVLIILLITLPLSIALLVIIAALTLVMWILCLPIRCVRSCFGQAPTAEEQQRGAFADAAQGAPYAVPAQQNATSENV